VARVLASAGSWAFTIALALYAYYEDGVTGVGLAVAVRTLPAAFAAPYVRSAAARLPRRHVFVATAALRALVLVAVTACVVTDFPFWVFLALVAAYRIAGVADRSDREVEEVGFLAGALAAGVCASLWTLDAVFAMCAGALALAAVAALAWPVASPARRARPAIGLVDARRVRLRWPWPVSWAGCSACRCSAWDAQSSQRQLSRIRRDRPAISSSSSPWEQSRPTTYSHPSRANFRSVSDFSLMVSR
jgi:hypothetical protein